jgi:hypothetical protein
LRIGIFDNGSVDNTKDFVRSLDKVYGIEIEYERSEIDLGCAVGTNRALGMVRDCEYGLHLESDFIHMNEIETGIDRMWLHRAIEFMDDGDCDYLYLRRMRNEREMMVHWWSQWMDKVVEERGEYLSCPGFWWSNNPALRRVKALYDCGTLPLNEGLDGKKGEAGWSMPELKAGRPSKAWIHRWGMFSHERLLGLEFPEMRGCGKFGPYGTSSCKYGFYMNTGNSFCLCCDERLGYEEMGEHERRYRL